MKNEKINPAQKLLDLSLGFILLISFFLLNGCQKAETPYVNNGDVTTTNDMQNARVSNTSGVVLKLKVFMQGYYLGRGMMAPVLANQAVLKATLSEADTVLVQLRDVTDPTKIVDAESILIMTDGTGTANFTVANSGSYWIVVKHRNSIQTWSAAPVALPATYNFTTAATQAFGGNMVDVNSESIFSMYTGDDNQDDFIDIFDFPDYDLDNQNFVAFEYKATDFNGDGFVDIFDFPVYDLNNQNFVFAITP